MNWLITKLAIWGITLILFAVHLAILCWWYHAAVKCEPVKTSIRSGLRDAITAVYALRWYYTTSFIACLILETFSPDGGM